MPRRRRNEIIVNVILDGSGSMESCKAEAITGFNAYIDELREDMGDDIKVTLTLFNSRATVIYADKPIAEVEYLTDKTYVPRGWTALYDAIGKTLLAPRPTTRRRTPPKMLYVIMTDGHENSSREFKREQIAHLIEQAQSEGNATFVYLGANQDAFLAARTLNIPHGNTMSYDARRVGETMSNLSVGTRSYRSAVGAGASNISNFWDGQPTDNGVDWRRGQEFERLVRRTRNGDA